jgi:hypothetical protein
MPSPFPGMNPYLEQDDAWHDFHERFIPAAAEWIEAGVGPRYIVRIDEHVYVHEGAERELVGRADVAIAQTEAWDGPATEQAYSESPVLVRLPVLDTAREGFIEVRDRRSRQLVTVVELVSPSNKLSGPDRRQYLDKRNQLLASPAHLVEIDLLRGGPRLPVDDLPPCDYYALVSRAEKRPEADIWPVHLRQRLPTIPIPLRPGDAPVMFDQQRVLDRVYDAAGYAKFIYETPPDPPLTLDDAAWARQFVPGAA